VRAAKAALGQTKAWLDFPDSTSPGGFAAVMPACFNSQDTAGGAAKASNLILPPPVTIVIHPLHGSASAALTRRLLVFLRCLLRSVKAGGPDPVANSKLADLLKQAKDLGVPKDIIERNIKKASDAKQGDFQECIYEAYGPGGTGFIIEALTDNVNRTAGAWRSRQASCRLCSCCGPA
jgi:hypothetical protein